MFSKRPFIVAGPCSIESFDQLKKVVQHLSENNRVHLIRCGVWKPRTQPGGFEGMGEVALKWIADLKTIFPNIMFAVEVAQPKHIELCLKYDIDVFWIGARTSGNPFSMSELSECIKGVNNVPIMIKNPPFPDVKLWAGAIERMKNIGVDRIAAIHRGFYSHNNCGYRNNPLWEIPIELKRIMPELPIICDPSHIAGDAKLVPMVAQTAMDMNFDGLMIEVHSDPQLALTDKYQQLSCQEFDALINKLNVKNNNTSADIELSLLRKNIDVLDDELLQTLAKRFEIVRQIAKIKNSNNLSVLQIDRWNEVLNKTICKAEEMKISTDFIRKIMEQIHAESVRIQCNNEWKSDKPAKE